MNYINAFLVICLSIFVIALTAAAVYFIFILREISQSLNIINKLINEARKKLNALTAILDLASIFISGVEGAKTKLKKKLVSEFMPSRAVIIGFFAGVKKGLKVLLGGED